MTTMSSVKILLPILTPLAMGRFPFWAFACTRCHHLARCQRNIHTGPIYRKYVKQPGLPSKTAQKAKNMAFIKHWNHENLAIFGPKLKISKIKLRKNAAKAEVVLDMDDSDDSDINESFSGFKSGSTATPEISENAEDGPPPPVPPPQTVKTKSYRKDSKPMPVLTDISELNGLLNFPLLNSENDDGQPPTDIPVLSGLTPPRVTRILDLTKSEQSQFALTRWIQQQITLLGKEGFGAAQKKRLRVASGLHGCVEQFLMGTQEHLLNIDADIEPYWRSISEVLSRVESVLGVEISVEHELLRYQGKADCIATYKGERCVIDWKTSSKPKASLTDLYDYPLQTVAYMGALQYSCSDAVNDDMRKANSMLLVISYEDGSPAHAHYIPPKRVEHYWAEWRKRLHKYWINLLSSTSGVGS